jgi:hypothetical protein
MILIILLAPLGLFLLLPLRLFNRGEPFVG